MRTANTRTGFVQNAMKPVESRDLEIFKEYKVDKPKPGVITFPVSNVHKHIPSGTVIESPELTAKKRQESILDDTAVVENEVQSHSLLAKISLFSQKTNGAAEKPV